MAIWNEVRVSVEVGIEDKVKVKVRVVVRVRVERGVSFIFSIYSERISLL